MEPSLRLGILGGTFDPVHFGHLRMAVEVCENLALDRVCLVPAAVPPHKGGEGISPFIHRLEMIRLAVGEDPLLDVLDLEGRRKGRSYTVQTLKELREIHSKDLELFFIIGTDAFLEIKTWKDFRRLFKYAHFVMVERPGISPEELEGFLESLDLGLVRTARGYRVGETGKHLIKTETTALAISATRIREAVSQGKSIHFLVPDSVESYLRERGLYKLNEDSG